MDWKRAQTIGRAIDIAIGINRAPNHTAEMMSILRWQTGEERTFVRARAQLVQSSGPSTTRADGLARPQPVAREMYPIARVDAHN